MLPIVLEPTSQPPRSLIGLVLTRDARAGGKRLLAKGRQLIEADLPKLALMDEPVHAVVLEPGDVHEDLAGLRLAQAIAGNGLDIQGPSQGRYNLVAQTRGLLRIDQQRLLQLNLLPALSVFTLQDLMAVNAGAVVCGIKITPVAAPESSLVAAEEIIGDHPIVSVLPFWPMSVGVVSSEPMSERMRARFQETVRQKVAWYGGNVLRFAEPEPEQPAIAAAILDLIADGAGMILAAGGSTLDPLDATQLALPTIGAEMIRFGAPAHPGSMFWVAERAGAPIVNLASCTLYSRATVADLVLPWIMARERVTPALVAGLGYGGLLDQGMEYRFPPYDLEINPSLKREPDES